MITFDNFRSLREIYIIGDDLQVPVLAFQLFATRQQIATKHRYNAPKSVSDRFENRIKQGLEVTNKIQVTDTAICFRPEFEPLRCAGKIKIF